MKTLFTFLLIFMSIFTFGQTPLTFNNPAVDTGVGLNRVVTFTNVGTIQGQSLDILVSINALYTSIPFDTLWHPNIQIGAVSGKFRLQYPHLDTIERYVGLDFKFVKAGTTECVPLDIDANFLDLDSTNHRHEHIVASNFNGVTFQGVYIDTTMMGDSTIFYAKESVNINNSNASVLIHYDNSCSFSIIFGVKSYINGGDTKYYMNLGVSGLLAIGDVILTDFGGHSEGCVNYLDWTVAQEKNLLYYEIQYSQEGIYFIPLDKVQPENKIFYEYPVLVQTSENYYRIKYIYTDGDVEYSHVIYVESDCFDSGLQVFPNPTKSGVYVYSRETIEFIDIINSIGQVLERIVINKQEHIYLDLLPIETSSFYLKIQYNNGTTEILKLVKYL